MKNDLRMIIKKIKNTKKQFKYVIMVIYFSGVDTIYSILQISMRKIDRVKKCFVEQGLDIALNGTKGQRAYEKKSDGDFEAHLIGK